MTGALADLFSTRTERNTKGTIRSEWDHELLHRDLARLIAEGVVENVPCPPHDGSDFRPSRCFRDVLTGETYVYVEGWERGSPEFRKV
jgi:hypothetical protein